VTDVTPTRDRIASPEGIAFRDLNGNGIMEPCENPTLPADEWVADLLTRMTRMTLEDKAGLMTRSRAVAPCGGSAGRSAGRERRR
jgi:beta-glucosidase